MAACLICCKMFSKLTDLRRHIRRVNEEATGTPSASVKSDTLSNSSENKLKTETKTSLSMSSETLLNRIQEMNVERHPADASMRSTYPSHTAMIR